MKCDVPQCCANGADCDQLGTPCHNDHEMPADQPLTVLVNHYGQPYADAYRAVVDSMPGRNAPERHMRGRVAHHFAVLTCCGDITSADSLTIAACALGYAEQQASWGAGNARAATAYAAVCSGCADPYRPNGPGESFGPSAVTAPTFADGDHVWFFPVLARSVRCRVASYNRETQRYSLLVTATTHPTYRRGERIVTSANWVRAR